MLNQPEQFNGKLLEILQTIANEGIINAAKGISTMVGQPLSVNQPKVKTINIKDIPTILGGPEIEAVGIYLKAEGDLPGHFMLIISIEKAFELADMLLELPTGTTTALGSLERSALAEVGNLSAAFFLNAVEDITSLSSRPTPPAVMVDMVGAILDIIVATTGGVSEHVLTFQATFTCGDRNVITDFWVIPDPATLKNLTDRM
jgi:chemotaxis protein CheC